MAAKDILYENQARSQIAHHLHGLRPHSPGGMDPTNLVPLWRSCHAKRHASRAAG